MGFVPGLSQAMIADNNPSEAIGYTVYAIHVFRMTTFFILAVFFARLLLERRNLRAFASNGSVCHCLPRGP
tara:strand:+ start:252 stop:464 length:213 start_codon:yes stop_codon:yes gene_type:complete